MTIFDFSSFDCLLPFWPQPYCGPRAREDRLIGHRDSCIQFKIIKQQIINNLVYIYTHIYIKFVCNIQYIANYKYFYFHTKVAINGVGDYTSTVAVKKKNVSWQKLVQR